MLQRRRRRRCHRLWWWPKSNSSKAVAASSAAAGASLVTIWWWTYVISAKLVVVVEKDLGVSTTIMSIAKTKEASARTTPTAPSESPLHAKHEGGDGVKRILVLSSNFRSGSSFLSELVSSLGNKESAYFFEPLRYEEIYGGLGDGDNKGNNGSTLLTTTTPGTEVMDLSNGIDWKSGGRCSAPLLLHCCCSLSIVYPLLPSPNESLSSSVCGVSGSFFPSLHHTYVRDQP